MKLAIDMEQLIFAWQQDSPLSDYFLDNQTGSIVLSQRDLRDLDDLRDEIESSPGRFVYVPKLDAQRLELDLSDFIYTINDTKLRTLLEVAGEGHNKVSNWMILLRRHPEELERWREWQRQCTLERVRKWLAAHDIQPED